MTLDRRSWIDRYAAELGVGRLDDTEIELILALASEAAHASERSAAPVSCWLAATSGLPIAVALERARALVAQLDNEVDASS